jgi:hypothetical protein
MAEGSVNGIGAGVNPIGARKPRVSFPNRFTRFEQCAGCVKKYGLDLCHINFAFSRSEMLAAFKRPLWDFFVPSTMRTHIVIVIAFDKKRKGLDLHAAWARASGGYPAQLGRSI